MTAINERRMDVVDYLRAWEAGAVGRPALYDEAADEIVLLRKVVQYLSDRIDFRPTNTIWMTGSPIDHAYKRALHSGSEREGGGA